MERLWDWLIEHLMQNGRAARDAPLVFVATFLIAALVAYWLASERYQRALDQKTATIDTLKTQLTGSQDRVKELKEQIQRQQQPQPSPITPPNRDPDGIYQFGVKVGTVEGVKVSESTGTVSFEVISDVGKLNDKTRFEYRDFILMVKSRGYELRGGFGGQSTRLFRQVVCEIVGRTK